MDLKWIENLRKAVYIFCFLRWLLKSHGQIRKLNKSSQGQMLSMHAEWEKGTEAELFPEMNSRHRVELTSIQLQWCWREQQTSFLPVTKVPSNLFVLSPSWLLSDRMGGDIWPQCCWNQTNQTLYRIQNQEIYSGSKNNPGHLKEKKEGELYVKSFEVHHAIKQ